LSILRRILLGKTRAKTYHIYFEMFIPFWRSGFLLYLRFEDLLSIELEDSVRIGFSYAM
jgi:hypothetical protein